MQKRGKTRKFASGIQNTTDVPDGPDESAKKLKCHSSPSLPLPSSQPPRVLRCCLLGHRLCPRHHQIWVRLRSHHPLRRDFGEVWALDLVTFYTHRSVLPRDKIRILSAVNDPGGPTRTIPFWSTCERASRGRMSRSGPISCARPEFLASRILQSASSEAQGTTHRARFACFEVLPHLLAPSLGTLRWQG